MSILAQAALLNAQLKAKQEEEDRASGNAATIDAVRVDLHSYDRVPVEEFGKALLRGMGWSDEDAKKEKELIADQTKIRPSLLGLGADPRLAVQNVEGGRRPGYHQKSKASSSSSSSSRPGAGGSSSSRSSSDSGKSQRFKPY